MANPFNFRSLLEDWSDNGSDNCSTDDYDTSDYDTESESEASRDEQLVPDFKPSNLSSFLSFFDPSESETPPIITPKKSLSAVDDSVIPDSVRRPPVQSSKSFEEATISLIETPPSLEVLTPDTTTPTEEEPLTTAAKSISKGLKRSSSVPNGDLPSYEHGQTQDASNLSTTTPITIKSRLSPTLSASPSPPSSPKLFSVPIPAIPSVLSPESKMHRASSSDSNTISGGTASVANGANSTNFKLTRKAEVVDYQITQGEKNYVIYRTNVQMGGNHWTIHRRYNDFFDLHNLLVKEHPLEADGFRLPKKRLFKRNKFDETHLQQRRAALDVYLSLVLAHPVLSDSVVLKAFLSDLWRKPKKKYTHLPEQKKVVLITGPNGRPSNARIGFDNDLTLKQLRRAIARSQQPRPRKTVQSTSSSGNSGAPRAKKLHSAAKPSISKLLKQKQQSVEQQYRQLLQIQHLQQPIVYNNKNNNDSNSNSNNKINNNDRNSISNANENGFDSDSSIESVSSFSSSDGSSGDGFNTNGKINNSNNNNNNNNDNVSNDSVSNGSGESSRINSPLKVVTVSDLPPVCPPRVRLLRSEFDCDRPFNYKGTSIKCNQRDRKWYLEKIEAFDKARKLAEEKSKRGSSLIDDEGTTTDGAAPVSSGLSFPININNDTSANEADDDGPKGPHDSIWDTYDSEYPTKRQINSKQHYLRDYHKRRFKPMRSM